MFLAAEENSMILGVEDRYNFVCYNLVCYNFSST